MVVGKGRKMVTGGLRDWMKNKIAKVTGMLRRSREKVGQGIGKGGAGHSLAYRRGDDLTSTYGLEDSPCLSRACCPLERRFTKCDCGFPSDESRTERVFCLRIASGVCGTLFPKCGATGEYYNVGRSPAETS